MTDTELKIAVTVPGGSITLHVCYLSELSYDLTC